MITWKELLCTYTEAEIPAEHLANLKMLLEKINVLRYNFGKPLSVSNAYRSKKHHLAIYAKKGIIDEKLIPMKSTHLRGLAVDLSGPNIKEFHQFLKDNEHLLAEQGIYVESLDHTPNWAHCQLGAPASGKRFFIP